jgi:hypothetical protein
MSHSPIFKVDPFPAPGIRYCTPNANLYYLHSAEQSGLDSNLLALLWNKYWISTLSSSSLVTNRDYTVKSVRDLAEKMVSKP